MSRILHHVSTKDFKKVYQRELDEQKKVLSEKIKVEEENKKIQEAAKPYKSNWRSTLTEAEWTVISGSGPTNSTAQTFGYYDGGILQTNIETGQPITFTASGLGGVEGVPDTTIIDYGFGDTQSVSAPTYNQLALAGYAKPLGFGVERRTDFQDVNPYLDASQEFAQAVGADYMMNARVQTIEDDLKKITAHFDSSLIENMDENIKLAIEAIKNGQQPSLVPPPDPPYTGMTYEQMVDEQNKIIEKYNDLLAPLYKTLDKYAGQLAPAGLVAKINALVEEQNKKQNEVYEKYSKYNEEYGNLLAKRADEWGKFVNAIESYRKGFSFNPPSQEVAQVASTDLNQMIKDMILYSNPQTAIIPVATHVAKVLKVPAQWMLKLVVGDYTPITKSPGEFHNKQVFDIIRAKYKMLDIGATTSKLAPKGAIPDDIYNRGMPSDFLTNFNIAAVRGSLGQFHYEVTPSGLKIKDTFNFGTNLNVGFLRVIPGTQQAANALVAVSDQVARMKGLNPRDDKFGIPIRYTIPWSQVPADLQNKLDPYQRFVPVRKKRQNESTTWDWTKKHLKGA